MRIDWLRIARDRNLRELEINFDETVPITVLLGPNGSGKSNLLEDCVEIFRALEQGLPCERFSYEIQYYCHGNKIVARSTHAPSASLEVMVNDGSVSLAEFRRRTREFLPAYVFAYYSGWNSRLEKQFAEPTRRYYRANLEEKDGSTPRRFFFCRKDYANLALLALFFESHELASHIRRELLGIESFESALFVLKAPWWARSQKKRATDDADSFFWGARGSFVDFMQRLRAASLAPIRNVETLESDVRGRTNTSERLYLYIRDRQHLEQLRAAHETSKLLFNHLESMYLSDLIEEIRVVARKRDGELVRFDQLSEGEQQLVTVFGLMLFTREDESLYLLDEPDSHLNPRWTYEYRDLLRRALFGGEKSITPGVDSLDLAREPGSIGSSQVLIGTHNPLMISAHPRSHVRILANDEGTTTAVPPDADPPGMSIDRLLTSEAFGLETALPRKTIDALQEHDRLVAKPGRSPAEQAQLDRLSTELDAMGLLRTYRLPEEREFIEAMRRREKRSSLGLSEEELRDRNRRADALLEQIFSKKS